MNVCQSSLAVAFVHARQCATCILPVGPSWPVALMESRFSGQLADLSQRPWFFHVNLQSGSCGQAVLNPRCEPPTLISSIGGQQSCQARVMAIVAIMRRREIRLPVSGGQTYVQEPGLLATLHTMRVSSWS
jgi:hypothetical protein